MPPQAPEKKHFDTTNSDDIKEAFHLFSQTIKELNEKLDKFANGSLKPQATQTKHFDTANPDDIKKSFLLFSQTIQDLIADLDKFESGFLRLERAKGLGSAITDVREVLQHTREVFFHNAVALVPGLHDLAHTEARESETRGSSLKRFYIQLQYFDDSELKYRDLPRVLKKLAKSFRLLLVRTDEFPEFTEQGSRLKYLLYTLDEFLLYRASCAEDHGDRLDTTVIQRYIHQFIDDLEIDFKKLASELNEFAANSIPAIRNEQARGATSLTNILAAATLFSGVTASTLQISIGLSKSDQNDTILVVNTLWFTSLILSVGAALNCVLNSAFVRLLDVIKPLISSQSNSGKLPKWIDWWMDGSHSFLLGASILTFSAGLSVFTFSSNQANYTPYLIIASMVLASAGLGAILIWILYKILMAKWQAGAFNPSGYSGFNKISEFCSGIVTCINYASAWLLPQKLNDPRDKDVEEGEYDGLEKPLRQEPDSSDEDEVRSITIGRKNKHDPDEINDSVALTELILPDEAVPEKIEFKSHGTIRDVEYSDDGQWLAITCVKEESYESWTTVLDAKTLQNNGAISYLGSAISEFLKWSPSGKKLIVQFESRCDVWDLAANLVKPIELKIDIQGVAWFDEGAFLVASDTNGVIKMDLTGHRTGLYEFKDNLIESISIERETNYLALFTYVMKTSEPSDLLYSGRSEKRIIIYDMEKRETIYQVPLLEDFRAIYWVPGTLDMLITQEDRKAFQLWSLSAGIKDPGSIDVFKKRTAGPEDNINVACMGGNDHQFIFNVMESGNIDIWRREPVRSYLRFQSPILQEEGVHCYSWRRSDDETATFATAGNGSHVLRIWRGKQVPAKTSNSPNLGMNEESRDPSQRAVDEAVTSSSASSVPPGAKEVEEENILKVDPPNGPEAGPSTSNS